MPSPFPGMDPFIESRLEWQGFHTRFLTYIADELNTSLPRNYATRIEERLVVIEDERDFRADLAIAFSPTPEAIPQPGASTAILERTVDAIDQPRFAATALPREPQRYIEIVALGENREVVSVIEVLSPSNKRGVGRAEYREKQKAVLSGGINLLEIDLLRGGQPAVALDYDKAAPTERPNPYVVCLSRAIRPDLAEFWPFSLRDRLPRIAVPLHEDEDDIPLDLQAVFTTVYDRGRYAQQLDYAADVNPPFSTVEAEWVRSTLSKVASRKEG